MAEQELNVPDEFDLSGGESKESISELEESENQEGSEEEKLIIPGMENEEDQEPDDSKAPAWVKKVREQNRALKKEVRDLKRNDPNQQKKEVGKKPTLEDFDHDPDAYESALEKWLDAKKAIESEEAEEQRRQTARQTEWNEKLKSYHKERAKLNIPEFDEYASVVEETLSVPQQGMIIDVANNPALIVAILGKNPLKAEELSNIHNPVKFAAEIARLEAGLKIPQSRVKTPPEKKITGNASPVGGGPDQVLEKLREEADKTGDRSKVAAYLRKKREAQAG